MRFSAALLLLLAPLSAAAQNIAPRARVYPLGTLLNGIALNGAAATRTFAIGSDLGSSNAVRDFEYLVLIFNHSAHGAASDVQLTCTDSHDSGTTEGLLQDCSSVTSGTCTTDDVVMKKSVSGVKVWRWRLGIASAERIECVVSATSANGSDLLTVTGRLVTR